MQYRDCTGVIHRGLPSDFSCVTFELVVVALSCIGLLFK